MYLPLLVFDARGVRRWLLAAILVAGTGHDGVVAGITVGIIAVVIGAHLINITAGN